MSSGNTLIRFYTKIVNTRCLQFQVGWPFSPPETILDLVHLEAVHDVFDLYLWLSYRFLVSQFIESSLK